MPQDYFEAREDPSGGRERAGGNGWPTGRCRSHPPLPPFPRLRSVLRLPPARPPGVGRSLRRPPRSPRVSARAIAPTESECSVFFHSSGRVLPPSLARRPSTHSFNRLPIVKKERAREQQPDFGRTLATRALAANHPTWTRHKLPTFPSNRARAMRFVVC